MIYCNPKVVKHWANWTGLGGRGLQESRETGDPRGGSSFNLVISSDNVNG